MARLWKGFKDEQWTRLRRTTREMSFYANPSKAVAVPYINPSQYAITSLNFQIAISILVVTHAIVYGRGLCRRSTDMNFTSGMVSMPFDGDS